MDNEFKINCSLRGFCAKGCGRQDKQLNTYDYLAGIPGNFNSSELVEVQFKHTRKGYYRNDNHLPLEKGDMVAVEASPGHDIGVVTLTGQLVPLQMKKANLKPGVEIKRVYRKARPADLDQYEAAKALEQNTMIRSRKIAQDLNLDMKIGDVEYQGDGNKAIFYYIADARVDFRQLIKVLAEAFHVRIEMKQIGARQEAGRIGGIGPCGRELCCATWMKNFNSVSTTAARFQDISPNPQKLAGQCAKLKCCLNYEVDTYVEASKKVPQRDVTLETADATYYQFKTDILAGLVTYSTDKRMAANLVTISVDRAQEIIRLNKNGEKPLALDDAAPVGPTKPIDLVEQEDLHRFDKNKRRKNSNKRRGQNADNKRDGEARDMANAQNGAPRNNPPKDGTPRDGERKGGRGRNGRKDDSAANPNPNAGREVQGKDGGRSPENNKRDNRNRRNNPNAEAKPESAPVTKASNGANAEQGASNGRPADGGNNNSDRNANSGRPQNAGKPKRNNAESNGERPADDGRGRNVNKEKDVRNVGQSENGQNVNRQRNEANRRRENRPEPAPQSNEGKADRKVDDQSQNDKK